MKFAVYALAVWRLTSLFVSEDGPFDVFARIRKAFGAYRAGEQGQLAVLITCFWCASIWTAAVLYLAPRYVVAVLGASGAAILADRVREKVDQR